MKAADFGSNAEAEAEALHDHLADLEGMVQATRKELGEYAGIEAAPARLEGHRNTLAPVER